MKKVKLSFKKIKNKTIIVFSLLTYINWKIYIKFLIMKFYTTETFIIIYFMTLITIIATFWVSVDEPKRIIKEMMQGEKK